MSDISDTINNQSVGVQLIIFFVIVIIIFVCTRGFIDLLCNIFDCKCKCNCCKRHKGNYMINI